MATELGKAYVQIVPSAQGIQGNIEKALSKESDSAGKAGGKKFGAGFASTAKSALKSSAAVLGKALTAGVGAAATGVGKIVKDSVSKYADFEQLKGGAELMFGEDVYSDFVSKRAAEAYKNVQMSQNDYLQQVNGFATGLKTSLGGDGRAAAELADRIVNAEADIVAATGMNAEGVQNAFNGIMKGQFQMLDNLGIGIKGSQEGMEAVIKTVNKANGTDYKMGNLADMQNALVDYVEYVGMAEYAHNEAAGTIQGSLASTKAAWENLLTGLADPDADVGQLFDNLIDSAKGLLKNLRPVVSQILKSLGSLVGEIGPLLSELLPELANEVLPELLSSAVSLVQALVTALPALLPPLARAAITAIQQLLPTLMQVLPALLQVLLQIVLMVVNALTAMAPQLIPAAAQMIMQLANGLISNAPALLIAALQLCMGLLQGLINAGPLLFSGATELIVNLVNGLIANLPTIIEMGVQLVIQLIVGLISQTDALIQAAGQLIVALINAFLNTDWKALGRSIISGVKSALTGGKADITRAARDLVADTSVAVDDIAVACGDSTSIIVSSGTEALRNEMSEMKGMLDSTAETATTAADTVSATISGLDTTLPALDTSTMMSSVEGVDITSAISLDSASLSTTFSSAATSAASTFTTYDWSATGNESASQIAAGMSGNGEIQAAAAAQTANAEAAFRSGSWNSIGYYISSGIASGVRSGSALITSAAKSAAMSAYESAKSALQVGSPSRLMADEVGHWVPAGVASGITENASAITDAMNAAVQPLANTGTAVRSAAYTNGRMAVRSASQTTQQDKRGEDALALFKEAFKQMKVELDEREVGRFVERTVVRGVRA